MSFSNSVSKFKGQAGIEYFDFEEDFVEENVRCIPMIVRFKLDAVGIKLQLQEWSKFSIEERLQLAVKKCITVDGIKDYRIYLESLIKKYTGNNATSLGIDEQPAWADLEKISPLLLEKAKEFNLEISLEQWNSLTNLQRFALLKLCRSGHENKNFPKAIREFGLIKN